MFDSTVFLTPRNFLGRTHKLTNSMTVKISKRVSKSGSSVKVFHSDSTISLVSRCYQQNYHVSDPFVGYPLDYLIVLLFNPLIILPMTHSSDTTKQQTMRCWGKSGARSGLCFFHTKHHLTISAQCYIFVCHGAYAWYIEEILYISNVTHIATATHLRGLSLISSVFARTHVIKLSPPLVALTFLSSAYLSLNTNKPKQGGKYAYQLEHP